MLEEIKKQLTLTQIKHFIFSRYSKLVLDTYPEINPTFGSLLIETILQSVFAISILFQEGLREYWIGEEISTIIDYCSYITLPNLYSSELIDLVIQALTIGILALYVLFFVLFMVGWISKMFKIFMAHMTRVLRVGCIPYFHVVVFNWFCNDCYALHFITLPILTLVFVVFFVCISMTLCFHFNPVPNQNNTLVRLHSNFYLYTFWLSFLKVLIIQSNGFSLEFVGVVFFLDLSKLHYVRGEQENKIIYLLRIPDLISILTCALILFVQFNKAFAVGTLTIWVIGVITFFIALVLQWFIKLDKNTSKVYDCLDASPREIVVMTQQFMMKDWGSLKTSQLFQYTTFICFHSNRCTDVKCNLKLQQQKLQKMDLNQLENYSQQIKSIFVKFILNILRKYSSSCPIVCTQYLMLCNHTNQNLQTLNIYPTDLISQQYVRHMIRQKSICETQTQDIDITLDNYQQSKSNLLAQFNKIIISLKQFLIELKIKKPNLDVLMRHGYDSYKQIEDLKKLFMKILRSDMFDLRIIEIYMEFMVNVLKEEDCVDYISRVSKNKWLTSSKDLQILDSSTPSLHIDPDEDKFFNMNAQAIKILKFHRMDIYDKKVSSFLHPFDTEKSLKTLFDELTARSKFCFIKDGAQAMLPAILSSRVKKGSKQACIIDIQGLSRLREESFILINKNREYVESHPETLVSPQSNLCIDMKYQYQNMIVKRISELFETKFINFQSQGCSIHATLSQTIHHQYFYIKISLKRRSNDLKDQHSIIKHSNIKQLEFHPNIHFTENKNSRIIIDGQWTMAEQNSLLDESIHMDLGDLDTIAQELLLDNKINYAEGIKSYRLDGEIIYNIELEQDGNEKAEDIVQERFEKVKQEDQYSRKKKIRIYYGLMVILSLIYIAIHIYVNVVKLDILKKQSSDHPLQTILAFQTRFQRMFGVLRDAHLDVKYVTTTNWNTQIQNLFDSIQNEQKSLKFSKTSISFTLLNTTYHSFLDYACNIFMTQIYRMGLYNTTENFDEVNQKSMQYLDPAIEKQKQTCLISLEQQLAAYVMTHIFTICFHAIIILSMLWLVVLINYHYRNEKQVIMLPWRSLSDEEIQSIIDRLSIFEVQLLLSERNEQVQIYDSLKDTNQYKKREYPKQLNKIDDKKNSYWTVFFLFLLSLGLTIHGYSLLVAKQEANLMNLSLMMNYRVPSSYIELVKASKFNSTINNQSVANLNNIVNDLQRIIPDLNYDPAFIDILNSIFYGEHCAIMQSVIPNMTSCEDYSIGFVYPNPLLIGYIIDVSALTFSMLDNITNLYICSGVIGYVYQIGVITFVNLLVDAKVKMIQKFYTDQVGYAMTNIVLCFFVFLIILLVYFTNITGIKRIQLTSRLLNISLDIQKGQRDQKSESKRKGSYQQIPDETKQQ